MQYPPQPIGRGITLPKGKSNKMSITESQLAAKRVQLDQESAALDAELAQVVSTKAYSALPGIEARINELSELRSELDRQDAVSKAVARHPLAQFGGAAADECRGVVADTKALKSGRAASPLGISEASMKSLYAAASSRQSLAVKAFSTVDGLLPAQLDPNVLGKIHEARLLDRLPAQTISAPSYEVIVHSSTTGAPTPVAEGAAKPELVLNTSSITLTAVKIAAHLGISYETLMDFSNFQSYAQTEMLAQLQDVENAQLLSGSGTSGNMTGFLHTSGILTHDASADTGTGVTVIDSIEMSIAALRVGSALATADLLVVHPQTWSAIRRLKDTTGRFLFIAADSDPTRSEANSIFGVPVLVTTAQTAGTGLLLDTTKFGRVLIREGITVHTGTNNDDLTKNIARFVMEERLVLAVERPAAVLAISNLPTA
jgi:HK97 family phage major capsid protein